MSHEFVQSDLMQSVTSFGFVLSDLTKSGISFGFVLNDLTICVTSDGVALAVLHSAFRISKSSKNICYFKVHNITGDIACGKRLLAFCSF